MKRILRSLFNSFLSLYAVMLLDSGFRIGGGLETLLYATILITFIHTFVKPLIKILLLPINLMTLGLFSWVINVIALYFLTIIVPQITIESWSYSGFVSNVIHIPPVRLSYVSNFIFVSLAISFVSRILNWFNK